MLLAYSSRLAPKFVIFRNAGKLEGWIDAGVFAAQLAGRETYPYERLRQQIRGLHKESILKTATAREALEQMRKLNVDHVPAVDEEHRFQFMLDRDDILSKVVTDVVLAGKRDKSQTT